MIRQRNSGNEEFETSSLTGLRNSGWLMMPALLRRMFWNFISQAEDACKRTLSSLRLPKKVSRANARDLVPNLSSFSVLPEPYQDLRIAIDSLIEFIVSIRGVFNRYVMTDDAPWLGAARYDQIPQIFVVSLDRSLPTANGKRFVKEIGHREGEYTFLGVLSHQHPDRGQCTRRSSKPPRQGLPPESHFPTLGLASLF